jgi:glycosyltransferase involved in cell wall biosynthesis
VIPTLNEENSIAVCIDSLLAQSYKQIGEILVVDGGSRDKTREIVTRYGGRVRLVDNPGITAASAMNLALSEVRNRVVVRIDAHTKYSVSYVERSVEVLLNSNATIVGGPMRPRGTNSFGKAVAIVTSSPLGVGPGKFHYSSTAGPVDTVYLGTFFVEDVVAVGGYDDQELQWAAEDQELNYRIRMAGGIVYLDPTIESWYEPRSSVRALCRQYRNYGLAKASTLKKHRKLPSWRPFAPAALLGLTVAGIVAGLLIQRPLVATTRTPSPHSICPSSTRLSLELCGWFLSGLDTNCSAATFRHST